MQMVDGHKLCPGQGLLSVPGMTLHHQLSLRVQMFPRRDPTDTPPILMPTVPSYKTLVSDEDTRTNGFSGHIVGMSDTVMHLSAVELPRGKPEMKNHSEVCVGEPWGAFGGSGVVTDACVHTFM